MKLINPEVRIETTARCQAACTICPREQMTRPRCVMPIDHFIYLVDQAKALGAEMISLFGHGEPLMDFVLEDKIQYCSENGLKTFITSNAGMLTKKRTHRLVYYGLSHIRFSVHGFKENYEKVHRGLEWNQVIDNIDYFIDHKHHCQVSISVIPMHRETVEEICAFWEAKDIDFLEIWKPHNWCYGKSYRWIKPMRRKRTCGRPENGPVQIQADGKMIVCCFDFDGKLVVGNTYEEDLKDILKGERYRTIREQHWRGDLTGLICETCDQLNIEDETPLLYSSRDDTRATGKTSSIKFMMED